MRKFLSYLLLDALLISLIVVNSPAETITSADEAFAEELSGVSSESSNTGVSYPFTRTFTISAYYSPLPCQRKYATGSYESDIRLNGRGVAGADGTPVYPGMVAAPKSYPFGTKLDIPGVGLVAVHDRGGAIKSYSGVNGIYDRLDIWMGYGDAGLERALKWGKRNLDVVVYGINDSLSEQIALPGYSEAEKQPNQCQYADPNSLAEIKFDTEPKVIRIEEEDSDYFETDLKLGDSGAEVRKLQEELTKLNLYRGPLTGYFGPLTEHAVFKLQQTQGLVMDKDSQFAGLFGPKTRDRVNEIIASRIYTGRVIAEASEKKAMLASSNSVNENTNKSVASEVKKDSNDEAAKAELANAAAEKQARLLASELDFGDSGSEVKLLQQFLKDEGYFQGFLVTDYYGPITQKSVIQFQLERGVIDHQGAKGAGRVGPSTLDAINSYYL